MITHASYADAPGQAAARPVFEANEIGIEYETPTGRVRSLDGVSLRVASGALVALVGESGSGKSTLGMAAGRLLATNAKITGGGIRVGDIDVLRCSRDELRRLRREFLGFIFQNPVTSLDPTMRIRRQLELAAKDITCESSIEEALSDVGLTEIPRLLRQYPHQLSGGMAQRVAIAMAIRRRPQLLIADEPTASVDATRRQQIMQLLVRKCEETRCALLLLTHDLHAVASFATHVAVMYGGRVVEFGPAGQVMTDPAHPYTRALLSTLPGEEKFGERLRGIAGVPPTLTGRSPGCAFAARCPDRLPHCHEVRPSVSQLSGSADRTVSCHLHPAPEDNRSQDTPAATATERRR